MTQFYPRIDKAVALILANMAIFGGSYGFAEEKKELPKLSEVELREAGDLQKQYQLLQAQMETLRLRLEKVSTTACNRVGILVQDCEITPEGEIRKKPAEKK